MVLIAEDLLLLLLDGEKGGLQAASQIQVALGGAVLSELAILGRAVVPAKAGWLDVPKVRATGVPPEHPLLAEAFATVAEKPLDPRKLVHRLGRGLKERLVADLVARGMIREERDRILGVFPRTRWPAADSRHEEQVRREMSTALAQTLVSDPHIGALIALLSALNVAHKVLEVPGLSSWELRKRAKRVADGEWAAQGVEDAIAATNAAIAAAVAASVAASTASS